MAKTRYKVPEKVIKLFEDIKCEEQTFSGCNTLTQDLINYYLHTTSEVQDIVDIAVAIFDRQQGQCSIYVRYDPSAFYMGQYKYLLRFGQLEQMLAGDVYIEGYRSINLQFFGIFIHELVHKVMHGLFRNLGNPYNESGNQKSYQDAVFKILQVSKLFNWGKKFENLAAHKYETWEYDREYVAKYYEIIANKNCDGKGEYFLSMHKWHNEILLPRAINQGFFSEYSLSQELYSKYRSENLMNFLDIDESFFISDDMKYCVPKISEKYEIDGLINRLGITHTIEVLYSINFFSKFDEYDIVRFIEKNGIKVINPLFDQGFNFANLSVFSLEGIIRFSGTEAMKLLVGVGVNFVNLDWYDLVSLIKALGMDIIKSLDESDTNFTDLSWDDLVDMINFLSEIGVEFTNLYECLSVDLVRSLGMDIIKPLIGVGVDFANLNYAYLVSLIQVFSFDIIKVLSEIEFNFASFKSGALELITRSIGVDVIKPLSDAGADFANLTVSDLIILVKILSVDVIKSLLDVGVDLTQFKVATLGVYMTRLLDAEIILSLSKAGVDFSNLDLCGVVVLVDSLGVDVIETLIDVRVDFTQFKPKTLEFHTKKLLDTRIILALSKKGADFTNLYTFVLKNLSKSLDIDINELTEFIASSAALGSSIGNEIHNQSSIEDQCFDENIELCGLNFDSGLGVFETSIYTNHT
ncbi:MAG: hypothetical protein HRU36_00825 [Rickettsiales bacterium]|nr:hypothetical protein [Rickettsiales bacterium]